MVLEYMIEGLEPGETVTVSIDIPQGVDDPAVYKIVDGELEKIEPTEEGEVSVKISMTDGGKWDEDHAVNGIIVDPVVVGSTASPVTTAAVGGSGGGGGCALSEGASPLSAVLLFLPLAFLYAARRKRKPPPVGPI
jgi:hypothetical protein